jgi:ATP-dependent RNA circularization protein (DNA/RNA ligase family)
VLSPLEVEVFLAHAVVLEEKVDGANLGLSLDAAGAIRAQNRGQYLQRPFSGQFARLNAWLAPHEEALINVLGGSLVLFGEWVAAVHSLEYESLPDYFLAFDVYDRVKMRFWSTVRRNALTSQLGIAVVHQVGAGRYQLGSLEQMITSTLSAYGDGGSEGLYLRNEDRDWLVARAKLVHPDFVQNMGKHWRSRSLSWNALSARCSQTH